MHEILFRGEDISGNWHEGLLQHTGNAWYISASSSKSIEVIPATIGQYTGINDKNGKKIFEDDVLRLRDFHGERTAVVFWRADLGCWAYGWDGYNDERISDSSEREVLGNRWGKFDLLDGMIYEVKRPIDREENPQEEPLRISLSATEAALMRLTGAKYATKNRRGDVQLWREKKPVWDEVFREFTETPYFLKTMSDIFPSLGRGDLMWLDGDEAVVERYFT